MSVRCLISKYATLTGLFVLSALFGAVHTAGDYSHFFNWFFVVRDPFYAIPEAIAPFIMPFLNIALFFAVEMLVYLVIYGARWIRKQP